jgi:hypothetical protein
VLTLQEQSFVLRFCCASSRVTDLNFSSLAPHRSPNKASPVLRLPPRQPLQATSLTGSATTPLANAGAAHNVLLGPDISSSGLWQRQRKAQETAETTSCPAASEPRTNMWVSKK